MTGKIQVLDYSEEPIKAYNVEFNCCHIYVNGKKYAEPVSDKKWLDTKHRKVAKALTALDNALLELAKSMY